MAVAAVAADDLLYFRTNNPANSHHVYFGEYQYGYGFYTLVK